MLRHTDSPSCLQLSAALQRFCEQLCSWSSWWLSSHSPSCSYLFFPAFPGPITLESHILTKGKSKGKVRPKTGHEGLEGEQRFSCTRWQNSTPASRSPSSLYWSWHRFSHFAFFECSSPCLSTLFRPIANKCKYRPQPLPAFITVPERASVQNLPGLPVSRKPADWK